MSALRFLRRHSVYRIGSDTNRFRERDRDQNQPKPRTLAPSGASAGSAVLTLFEQRIGQAQPHDFLQF